MKKLIQTIVIVGMMILSNFKVNAQVSVGSNSGVSTDYVGWDANQNFPLIIAQKRTAAPQPIDFYTNNTKYLSLTTNGDLDLVSSSKAYKIAGNTILMTPA
ncbi:MAG: hypothetical protein HY841_07340 [Bacteroidetes bacterium]|nr:hypothetical protein [Bacteroidota bacterium]